MNKFEKALSQPEQNNTSIIYSDDKAKNDTLRYALSVLREALQEDKDSGGSYFHAWQCNIAMAFVDEYEKYDAELSAESAQNGTEATISRFHLYEIANKAAINFINNLCATR